MLDPECVERKRDKIPGYGRDARIISLSALKVLRFLQTREYDTIRALQLNSEIHAEVGGIMLKHIQHHLERNLKSVEFLRMLKREIPQPERILIHG